MLLIFFNFLKKQGNFVYIAKCLLCEVCMFIHNNSLNITQPLFSFDRYTFNNNNNIYINE